MKRLVLALADRARPLLRALGIDDRLFRLLLETKLELDRRRVLTPFAYAGGGTPAPGRTGQRTLAFAVQTFMGVIMAVMAGVLPPLAGLGLVHAFVMLMLAMTLLAEFSTVLHDPLDDALLAALPIDARTALAARAAFAGSFVALNAACLGGPAAAVGLFRGSIAYVPAYLLSLALNALLTLLLVHLVYLVTMSLCTPTRFREVMNTVQIALSVVFSAWYIVLPRLFDFGEPSAHELGGWALALPPLWLAALPALTLGARADGLTAAAAAGLVAPALGTVLVFRVLAPVYRRRLQAGAGTPARRVRDGEGDGGGPPRRRRRRREPLLDRLAARTLGPEGGAAFRVVSALAARDRAFRLRVYPLLAMLAVAWGVNPLLQSARRGGLLDNLRAGHGFVLLLYAAVFAGSLPLTELARGDAASGAWVWRALPFARPGQVFAGALMAIVRRFVGPLFALAALATVAVWGPWRLADVAVAACAVPVVLGGIFGLTQRVLPFSRPTGQQAEAQPANTMAMMLLIALLGGVHYVLTVLVPWLLLPAAAVLLALGVPALRRAARTSWAEVVE